jgi:hypothetical protein
MKKRWFICILVGVLFGIFDFYYQELTQGIVTSSLLWFIVAWGIWLMPVIPIVLYAAKASQSKLISTLASIVTWCTAVISYYVFLMMKLIFIGQATRPELYITNYKDPFYWSNLKSVFLGDVLGGIIEWILIAAVGGGIVGFSVSFIYLRVKKSSHV